MPLGPAASPRWLLTCLLAASTCGQARDFDPSILAHAQGTYRFDDGTCVTGGRMDEGGIRLLYMDVRENRLALLARMEDGALRMLVPPGSELRLADDGRTLTLTDGAVRGHRVNAALTWLPHPPAQGRRPVRASSGRLVAMRRTPC